ncbi:hypothetical protein, partial [Pseudomonas sp.]|uniref:hypothetical protein n=1 Tax=Pseudomonas sp. TaxID=306 RepID=UPI003CC5E855
MHATAAAAAARLRLHNGVTAAGRKFKHIHSKKIPAVMLHCEVAHSPSAMEPAMNRNDLRHVD